MTPSTCYTFNSRTSQITMCKINHFLSEVNERRKTSEGTPRILYNHPSSPRCCSLQYLLRKRTTANRITITEKKQDNTINTMAYQTIFGFQSRRRRRTIHSSSCSVANFSRLITVRLFRKLNRILLLSLIFAHDAAFFHVLLPNRIHQNAKADCYLRGPCNVWNKNDDVRRRKKYQQ